MKGCWNWTCGLDSLACGVLFTLLAGMATAQEYVTARAVRTPPLDGVNAFYHGNLAPLVPNPLIKLPVGAVQPHGWLLHQLGMMRNGFTGHLTEISKWCKFEGSAWASRDGEGANGWEELPYWLKGFIDLGYVLGDRRIIAESSRWIDAVLSDQDSSGYFGPRANKKTPDLWPNMIMLYALRTHYEATHDPRVIPFVTRYFRWLNTVPLEKYLPGSWQKIRGGDNLDHILWLYNQTGEAWLLKLARVNHERTSDWTGGIPTWHGVNLCQGFREPAEYYQEAGDRRYLAATVRDYDSVMSLYGQVPGGMFGADENARKRYTGPRQGAETCSMVEFMHSDEMLAGITGDPVWADRCEEIAFNSLPAAMTPDLKGLHYLTAPNQVQLDTASKAPMIENDGDMFSYDPWDYRCCQHNVSNGWPYFAENLWMATRGNGVAAVMYAPCEVSVRVGGGAKAHIDEVTDYPFGETVQFKFSLGRPSAFPLLLRVPGWCARPVVKVNGREVITGASPLSWIELNREWKEGDVVILDLPQTFSVTEWEKNSGGVSVMRGPLWYSLRIGERWLRNGGTDAWPAMEVFPATPWNYGLVLDTKDPGASFKLSMRSGPMDPQPFSLDGTPIEVRAEGRRIPGWKLESNGMIGNLMQSPVVTDAPEETITLVPMGCARLRVSVFPVVSPHVAQQLHE